MIQKLSFCQSEGRKKKKNIDTILETTIVAKEKIDISPRRIRIARADKLCGTPATQGESGANKEPNAPLFYRLRGCTIALVSASMVSAGRWQWRPALSGQERKKRRILRGRRSTFLVGLKRESRLSVHCAPRSCRMSQSVTATALTILSVHTRTHAHTSRERNGGTPLDRVTHCGCFYFVETDRPIPSQDFVLSILF